MLNIILEYRKGILFARLTGELTKKTIDYFEKTVLIKMKQGGIYHIVYNFEGLFKIDRYGYNRILYSHELCKKHSGEVFIVNNMKEEVSNFLKQNRITNYASYIPDELAVFKEVFV